MQICVGAGTRLHTNLHKGVPQGTHKACTRQRGMHKEHAQGTTHKATHKANKIVHKALHKVFDDEEYLLVQSLVQ